ncbi:uncharacterized protein LOC101740371 [Bombyx mori]|uniref:Endonuclease/exonuclease/phosphatase domain-containing protein n=1 Tax=Bombyx mori TaxID=7091 RepID=A0A8R2LZK2_BOMMO|nr:uncharacterized protein LOC101740371 [Bombyx mori]
MTFIYSGKDITDNHESGVGILMTTNAKSSLLDWHPVSDRIIMARFYSRVRNISVIQCYAPTNAASSVTKAKFYSHLQSTLQKIKRQDIVICMGDFNAQLGSDNTNIEPWLGRHAMGRRSENGDMLIDLCCQNDLIVGGSIFPHKSCHKVTWVSPDRITENHIDHVLISRKWRRSLLDVRNKRGADINSDHHLVVAKIKLKVAKIQRTAKTASRNFDTEKLRNPTTKQNFQDDLRNRTVNISCEEGTIEDHWESVRGAFRESCQSVLGYKCTPKKKWISGTTWDMIQARQQKKEQINSAQTLEAKEELAYEYYICESKIKLNLKKDKRAWTEAIAQKAELAAYSGNMSELHKSAKILCNKPIADKPLRDDAGNLLVTLEQQLVGWREHFAKVFEARPTATIVGHEPSQKLLDIEVGPPVVTEIKKAITSLKSGKAPGGDGITAEVLKADVNLTTQILHPLLSRIW